MKKIDLGQTISVLANLGVIAGIVFLAIELRQNNELLHVQVDMVLSDVQANSLLADIVNQPELLELLTKDKESLTEFEHQRLLAMGLRGLRNWQGRHNLAKRGLLDLETVGRDMSNTYHREILNYGIPEAWEFYKQGFPPDFVQWFDENVVNRPQ